jgi:hypothetical protein
MTFFKVVALLLFPFTLVAQNAAKDKFINETLYEATASLYEQNNSGSFEHICTVAAIQHIEDGYIFATASHCVEDELNRDFYYVGSDEGGEQRLMPVVAYERGSLPNGYDVALLRVKTTTFFPVISVGTGKDIRRGEPIYTVAAAEGVGKLVLNGFIAMPVLHRPYADNKTNWSTFMMLQVAGLGPGASGAPVICERQQALCGIFVGTFANEPVAVPVERVREFIAFINKKQNNFLGVVISP